MGDPTAAPELRKTPAVAPAAAAYAMQTCELSRCANGVQPAAGQDVNNASEMHDSDVLPHMYDQVEMDRIFEKAEAPAELDCAPTGGCICSRPECGECFPPPLPEFGPPVVNAETWLVSADEAVDVRSPCEPRRVDRGGAVKSSFCDGTPKIACESGKQRRRR